MGCINSCGDIEFPVVSVIEGDHIVSIEYRGVTHNFIQSIVYPDVPIVIPAGLLNENYEHIISVIDPDGDELIYSFEGTDYDCFRITTKPAILAEAIEVRGEIHSPSIVE